MLDRTVYVDNAATTKLDEAVLKDMLPYFTEIYGNPSSLHSTGVEALKVLTKAREDIAEALNCEAKEIYFTSGGTEADNWAVRGAAYARMKKGKHIITSAIEHHAVHHPLKILEKEGFEVTYLPVYENGIVRVEDVKRLIRDDTILVTIMLANNEIGTIQPIKEIAEITREKGILLHTDAVQAVGQIPVDIKDLNVDLMSFTAHKLYGPKGIGALFIRNGVVINRFMEGGAQERNRRAGTENIAGAVGFASAVKRAVASLEENSAKLTKMRDRLIKTVLTTIPYTRLNGDAEKRLPGNANFSIEYIEGESILLMLDLNKISASSGSACTSGSLDPSHVLLALGLSHEVAHGSLRISLGHNNTEEDIDYILEVLPKITKTLRNMSPLWEKVEKREN
ncbi:MAG: cysteine desulfurase NifS [Ruminococcaceae bacterium]|nr:cysteine desulfurase NifS [Oscillospiraceae bacterium]